MINLKNINKKSVSLFLKLSDSNEIILAKRAKSEKRPGVLQATVHGGIDNNEKEFESLKREFKEELNGDINDIQDLNFVKKEVVGKNKDELCFFYTASITKDYLNKLNVGPEVDSLVLIDLDNLDSVSGYEDPICKNFNDDKIMFLDEYNFLKELKNKVI